MDQDADMVGSNDASPVSFSSSPIDAKSQQEPTDGFLEKGQKRFRVRKWAAIALWAYDITVDNCAICRNHIMDKCIECQSVQETTDIDESCNIAWGKCSHVFHMHCISRWLNTRQVCPLDNRNWEFKRYGT